MPELTPRTTPLARRVEWVSGVWVRINGDLLATEGIQGTRSYSNNDHQRRRRFALLVALAAPFGQPAGGVNTNVGEPVSNARASSLANS